MKSAEPNLLVVQRDDESLSVRTTELPTVEPGVRAQITAHSDARGELVLDALEVEGKTIVEGDAPEHFGDEERHDAWRVIEVLVAQALEASRADLADGVSRLAAVDWQRDDDALRCVTLVERVFESEARTNVGAEELARSRTLTRFPNAGARVARVLLSHGDGATPTVAQALVIAGQSVAAGAASDEIELVRRAIDSAQSAAGARSSPPR